MDTRWGGLFGIDHAHFIFAGSIEDVKSTFLGDFDECYNKELFAPKYFQASWVVYKDFQTHNNWYKYKGGLDAYQNPDETDATVSFLG